jgi:hypothetical protein
MKNKCPSCPKEYQSPIDLERHCLKYHGKSLESMQHKEVLTVGHLHSGKIDSMVKIIIKEKKGD